MLGRLLAPTPSSAVSPSWRPDLDQRLLLEAALCGGARATAAWEQWAAGRGDDQVIDRGSERLMPLVAHNLAKLGITDHPRLRRARSDRTRLRFGGVVLASNVADWTAALAARGVSSLLLKGFSLASRYYGDFGLRPMDDVDFLVRASDTPVALRWLAEVGFTPTEFLPGACWPPRADSTNLATASVTHGCGFVDNAGRQLDLHWAALSTHCTEVADAGLWGRAVPLSVKGTSAYAQSPADELVHTLTHGLRWNSVPSIRWVADAATIIRPLREPADGVSLVVDWAIFLDAVRARGVARAIAQLLAVLTDLDVPVPPHVTAAVAAIAMNATCVDTLRARHAAWPWDEPKPLDVLAFDAWRFADGLSPIEAARRIGRYLWYRVAPSGRLSAVPQAVLGKLSPYLGKASRAPDTPESSATP